MTRTKTISIWTGIVTGILGFLVTAFGVFQSWRLSNSNEKVSTVTNQYDASKGLAERLTVENGDLKKSVADLTKTKSDLEAQIAQLKKQPGSAGGTSTPPPDSPNSAVPPGVRNQGTLQVTSDTPLWDLDAIDSEWGTTQASGDGFGEGPRVYSTYIDIGYDGARLLPMGKQKLSLNVCKSKAPLMTNHQIRLSKLDSGSTMCLKTTAGRFASLTVVGDPNPSLMTMNVVVWDKG